MQLFPLHVNMPKTVEELPDIEAAYESIGIPGACGSIDVVHIALGRCPYGLKTYARERKGIRRLDTT